MTGNFKIEIRHLVKNFKEQDGQRRSEEDIQTSFTIKLMEVLGWDSSHWAINTGQDVKTGKKPDIVLKSGSSKLIVIESKDAKKKDMLDGSYGNKTFKQQLFNYCKAEGVAWGILTNFIEWRLYSVHHSRLYKEKKYAFYDLLWPNADKSSYVDLLSDEGMQFLNLISKENLIKKNGIIDPDPIYYPEQLDIEQEKIKKEFFSKIKNWRENLRKFINKNYSKYTLEEVDLMAQKILDRMIFIDICHDKGIVYENHLRAILSSKLPKYEELKEKFKVMNEKFNTELFAQNTIDEIKISNDVIIPIIEELDEIDFSKLSVHIIGEVYENYLGEIAKGNVKKEDVMKAKQKNKRKSQGIYYTPDYIVDYIVKKTVGELLKKAKTKEDIEKIRVLDPACGSGSFLIRAFDEFFEAYKRVMKEGGLLGFEIKKKILQNNLFGVDLDPKAVEIAKLNLMIKALEGATPNELRGDHLLPNLNLNIRCGNSLIGGEKLKEKENNLNLFDKFDDEIKKLIDFKERFRKSISNDEKKEILNEINIFEGYINKEVNDSLYKYFKNLNRIRPFNYTIAFCEIFKDGGFDAVIGNPPYIRPHRIDTSIKGYLWENYYSFKAKSDIYVCFIENAIQLTKKGGLISYIVSNTWLSLESFENLRTFILNNTKIKMLINPPAKVFSGAQVSTIVFVFEKDESKGNKIIVGGLSQNAFKLEGAIKQTLFNKTHKKVFDLSLLDKQVFSIKVATTPLKKVAKFYYGIKTGDDEKFLTFKPKDKNNYKQLLRRSDFNRYLIDYKGEYVWYAPELMKENKATARPGEPKRFDETKIIITDIAKKIIATLDLRHYYIKDALILHQIKNGYDLRYLLGVINSKLLNFIYTKTFRNLSVAKNAFMQLPIKIIEISEEKALYNTIVRLVDQLLKLNKTTESREINKTKIQALDYEIDKMVYKLYGLGESEIKTIEQAVK
ncbi:MAG TPA: N-6 DNA methylase [Candidatus Bipolaricaulota bacterium]|nr:N-6 DNA methylase [Candidatus Bipolaricaulota bacterium]